MPPASAGPARTRRQGRDHRAPKVGLVLGAGGITGFAYHSGALSALQQSTGWDPRTASVIVGTSAGAGVGAMLRGGVPIDEVLGHLLAAPSNPETMARLRVLSGRDSNTQRWWWFGPSSPRLTVRELSRPLSARPGRLAISLLPNGRIPTDFLGDRVRQLHGAGWPDERLWLCAVRLADGERVVFGAGAGLGLAGDASPNPVPETDVGTAVEASSAIPAFFRPVAIAGARFIDGAIHSPTNVDVAAGLDLDLLVVSSPMSGQGWAALRSLDAISRMGASAALRRELAEQPDDRATLVLEPDVDDVTTMGPINMDPTRMVPTVLQSRASTLRRLAATPDDDRPLSLLRAAADAAPTLPRVAYPTGSVPRAS